MTATLFRATFRVDGIPKAQPRPKAYRRGNYTGVYDPGTAGAWQGLVVTAGRANRPDAPLDGALELVLVFDMPRPKKFMRRCDPAEPIPCASKPDADNLAKAVMDAMTQDGWWRDDAQVARLVVEKRYHSRDSRPGASVRVESAP